MAVSTRGRRWLARLETRAAPSIVEVREVFAQRKIPLFDPWVAFQEQYAGRVLGIGIDAFVLGIYHPGCEWLEDGIGFDEHRGERYIDCADGHPSHHFVLDARGKFLGIGSGGPCDNFDKYVEQQALVNIEDVARGRRPSPQELQRFAAECSIDAAASDSHTTWRVGPPGVLCEWASGDAWIWPRVSS